MPNVIPMGDASLLVGLVFVEDPTQQRGARPVSGAQVAEFWKLNPPHLAGVEIRVLVVDCL